MKKRNGFSLAELLAVIVLLGIISIILVPNITKLLKDSKEDLYNKQIKVIELATKLWATDKENKIFLVNNQEWPYIVTLGDLQDASYIDENIVNPNTDENFSDSTLIYINYENNQYTYEVDKDTVNGETKIITLQGERNYKLEVNSNYIEPGYSAKDLEGKDITTTIETSINKNGLPIEEIDTSILTNYTIKYTVTYKDKEGNTKTGIAFRRIKVVDTTAPEITCLECIDNIIEIESTDTYTLPEITAIDNYDREISLTKIGSISTKIPGERKITYIATDSSGNSSKYELKLIVKDTIGPIIIEIDRVENDNGYVIYTVEAKDEGSGIKEYSINGGLTWQESNIFEVEEEPVIRNFIVKDKAGNITLRQISEEFTAEFAYTGDVQTYVVPKSGYYKIEAWGAQGGSTQGTDTNNIHSGGNGAYTSGIIELFEGEKLYVNVGGKGSKAELLENLTIGGYNGGGGANYGAGTGGGATDIRFNGNLLNDRIMVASGGGGAGIFSELETGGSGGTFVGLVGGSYFNEETTGRFGGAGGTQISGGLAGNPWTEQIRDGIFLGTNGEFGIGGEGGYELKYEQGAGAGGGGYYGGGGGSERNGGGAGGSSYISGHLGCVAITSQTDTTPLVNIADGTASLSYSYHYSGKKFTNTKMISGNGEMPSYDGLLTMIGNKGNGYAKITFLGEIN